MIEAAERLNEVAPFRDLDVWSRPFTRGELAAEVIRLIRSGAAERSGAVAGYLDELADELAPEIADLERGTNENGVARGDEERLREGRYTLRGESDLSLQSEREASFRGIALLDGAVSVSRHVAWRQRLEIDSRGGDDPDFDGRPWKNGVAAQFRAASASIDFGAFRFTAGRRPVSWGVGLEGGMLLGRPKPSFDQLSARVRLGRFGAEAFTAPLDGLETTGADGEVVTARRFLAAHRITFRAGGLLYVALSESVVYGGENRSFDWAYANPLLLEYAVQWNRKQNDNTLWSAEAYVRAGEHADLFGEFLVDDFQYDLKTEPNQIGFLAGARLHRFGALPGLFVDGEYARIHNWVYGHDVPWNRYVYGGDRERPLGHPLGPDGDRTLVRVLYRHGRTWEWGGRFFYGRRGEGRIDDPRESAVPFGNTFLTGSVTLRRGGGVSFGWHPDEARRFRLDADRTEGEWTVTVSALIRLASDGIVR